MAGPQVVGTPVRTGQAHVARTLGVAILAGEYSVGSILPTEAELMARFGVSRTVLREVLKTLAAKGLVQSKTKVGTRVLPSETWNMFDADVLAWRLEKGIDRSLLISLFEIREALEPAAAALAAVRRSPQQLARLRAIAADMFRPDHTTESFAEADLRLHLEIAAASGNPFMRSIGAIIDAALTAAFAMISPSDDRERQQEAARNHSAIVEAIARHDAEAARAAMLAVITVGRRHRNILVSDSSGKAP
jgi:DNA-binding FadR family transcriptional regulator